MEKKEGMVTFNDDWFNQETTVEMFKENYIKLIKQKKKNGEQITESKIKWLKSYKVSLDDL